MGKGGGAACEAGREDAEGAEGTGGVCLTEGRMWMEDGRAGAGKGVLVGTWLWLGGAGKLADSCRANALKACRMLARSAALNFLHQPKQINGLLGRVSASGGGQIPRSYTVFMVCVWLHTIVYGLMASIYKPTGTTNCIETNSQVWSTLAISGWSEVQHPQTCREHRK